MSIETKEKMACLLTLMCAVFIGFMVGMGWM
jgi:hypothetical protein